MRSADVVGLSWTGSRRPLSVEGKGKQIPGVGTGKKNAKKNVKGGET
jgi:hypothetical protein